MKKQKQNPKEIIEVYKLKTDQYGQPTGNFETLSMTREEYETRRKYEWLFDDYMSALFVSQD